jgi:hypothetical protein
MLAMIEVKSCIECPFHKVIPDPDLDDWFNDDDMAVICTKEKNELKGKFNSPAYQQEHRIVESSLRPHEVKGIDYIPVWCPFVEL